ncbi:hypothetical protein A2U01_0004188 [Trifolium medium]|uniref:Uncharacterized protein n=1 Tax=Trifolium medium TaxID=97028 RepID=A0A392M823_9FABA|nr:hypothetical protein [Trifolium medium]
MLILGSICVPTHIPLYTVPFWVQEHKLMMYSMSEKNGKQIASSLVVSWVILMTRDLLFSAVDDDRTGEMSILVWNNQGLRNPSAVPTISDLACTTTF